MSNFNLLLSESYYPDRIRVYASALIVVYLNLLSCPVVVFLRRKIDEKSQENQQAGQAQRGGQQASKSIPTLLKDNRGVIIRGFVILQTYLFLSCSLAIFAIAHTFGKARQCNDLFVVTLFHPFPVLPTSRRVLLGLFGAATVAYSGRYVVIIGKAVRRRRAKKSGGDQPPDDADSFKTSKGKMEEFFDKWFVTTVVGLIVLSALHVTNTELLKLYNERRTSKVDNSWSFGQVSQVNCPPLGLSSSPFTQILPLFLAAYSVWLAVSNFWDLRCNNKKAVSDTEAEEVNEFPGEEIRLGDNNHSDNYRNYN